MDIILHIPENTNEKERLDTRIAKAHAEAVIEYIKSISNSPEEKALLFKALLKRL